MYFSFKIPIFLLIFKSRKCFFHCSKPIILTICCDTDYSDSPAALTVHWIIVWSYSEKTLSFSSTIDPVQEE